jgi:iron complex outermembrane receptor protein
MPAMANAFRRITRGGGRHPAAVCALAAAVVLCAAQDAGAQAVSALATPLKALSLEELGDVVVTSVSKEPEPVWRTAAAIYVLTHDDIVRSGATSIPDALRLVPGVEVARIDTSRNWVVGIRGFGDQFSKSVLVLIDGRTAYTPLWAGVHWPIQDTLLEDVDRIEVIRGAGGTIWGANAENGVINVITKSSRDTHGVYGSVTSGNVDQAIGGVRFGGATANGLNYRVYGQGIRRAPQFHTDGRNFDTWDMGQGGFRLDWEGTRDQLSVQGDAYKAQLGESVRVSTFTPAASFLVDDPIDVSGGNLILRWRRALRRGSDVTVQSSVDHTYRLGTDFGERRTTVDVDAIHHWRAAARNDIIWGLGARTSPGHLIQTYAFSNFEPHDQTLNLLSAFAQDSVTLVPRRLLVTGGVKVERNSYTGIETQPSGRVMWTPTNRQTVWGGVTRAVRTPSRLDEDITVLGFARADPLIYGVISGNRSLDAERVIAAEAGYRTLLKPSLYVDVTAFRNDYDNLVDLGSPTTRTQTTEGVSYLAVVFPYINGITGPTHGFELAPDWQPSRTFRLRGSYSFFDLALRPKGGNAQISVLPMLRGSTPHHEVTVQSLMTLPRGIQLDPIYRYVSARTGPAPIPAYQTADVHLGIPVGRGFDLSIVGQNLLQPHHPEWARDPGPTVEIRRSAYARINWRR